MIGRRPLTVLVALAAACAGRGGGGEGDAPGVKDSELGLSRTSVFDAPAPPLSRPIEAGPGEGPLVARAYPDAPPRIPHAIGDFLPITLDQNSCVDCHGAAEAKEPGQPTPLPPSHYTDLRRPGSAPGEKVAGGRWACTACHVPLTDAKPLVESRFGK
jgi:nitrate reductase cytochrome c-type subunit